MAKIGEKHCGRTILLLQSRQDQAVHADRALGSLSVHYNATFIVARARLNLNREAQRDKTKCADGADPFLILTGCLGTLLLLRKHMVKLRTGSNAMFGTVKKTHLYMIAFGS